MTGCVSSFSVPILSLFLSEKVLLGQRQRMCFPVSLWLEAPCHAAWEEGLCGTASRGLTSLGSEAFAVRFSSSLELGLMDGAPIASCILK